MRFERLRRRFSAMRGHMFERRVYYSSRDLSDEEIAAIDSAFAEIDTAFRQIDRAFDQINRAMRKARP